MAAAQPDASTALATRREAAEGQQDAPPPLPARIERLQPSFAVALPRGVEAVRFVRDALTCLRTVRDLDKCDPDSVLGALMTCAQLGLRPGVLGHAWPLPFWDGRTQSMRAQLVIGYQGYIELGHRSGEIADIVARTVHTRDHFDVDYGVANSLIHRPLLDDDPGPAVAYYAIVRYRGGGHTFIVMGRRQVEAHRDRYAPRNRQKQIVGPWADPAAFDSMAMKTCVRALAKWMPKSTDLLGEAVAADGGLRISADPKLMPSDVTGSAMVWDDVTEVPAAITTTPSEPAPAAREPAEQPSTSRAARPRTQSAKLLQQLHILRNQLEGFAGTTDEARDLFLVHVASVIGHEVASTKDLTEAELELIIQDLKRAKQAQDDSKVPNATARAIAGEKFPADPGDEPPY